MDRFSFNLGETFMNALVKPQIRRVNSFTAKIIRDGDIEDFNAKFFTLELKDFPDFEGRKWVFTAEHTVKNDENRIDKKTITLIFPESTVTGEFFIPIDPKGLSLDYVDTADLEPHIHIATKGTVVLTLTHKGDELSDIAGKLDVTVSDTDGRSFAISGVLSYSTSTY
jgi:hypothetical protein